jgi:FkbM family methyltransferase
VNFIKSLIKKLPFAITKNQKYDAQTERIMRTVLSNRSNCVDIGCHKGEMLDLMLKFAPQGQHFCFEPIPNLYQGLLQKSYPENCHFYELGLSNEIGTASFNYVISNPAYSGFIKRRYDKPNEQDTMITVRKDLLDHIVPENTPIAFIKIDVEGAELEVLQGAVKTIIRTKPIIVFEHGIGASDCYGTKPQDIFDVLVHQCGMHISLMSRYLNREAPFTFSEFEDQFNKEKNYYFISYP